MQTNKGVSRTLSFLVGGVFFRGGMGFTNKLLNTTSKFYIHFSYAFTSQTNILEVVESNTESPWIRSCNLHTLNSGRNYVCGSVSNSF